MLKKTWGENFKKKKGEYLVYGKGLGSFYAKKNTIINCGNSGTTARLLIALISTTPEYKSKNNRRQIFKQKKYEKVN